MLSGVSTFSTPPLYELVDGPAAGRHPVFPDINGELPAYVVVPQHLQPDQPPGADTHRIEHIYMQIFLSRSIFFLGRPAARYQYLRSIPDAHRQPHITCPRCGRTSYNASDVAQGYCGHCHDWTRIDRYAVIHPAPGIALPTGLVGLWFRRDQVDAMLAGSRLTAHPTGAYVLGAAGGYAEVFQAHHTEPEPAIPELL